MVIIFVTECELCLEKIISSAGWSGGGAAALEFALVVNLLLVLIMGMIDFRHAWCLRQVITNASREGARAGVVYPHDVMDIQE
jgi:hypothetical protein